MSQNQGNPGDPQDLENQFSEDMQPLSIDSPNDFYDYQDDSDDRFPLTAVVLGGIVILLTLAGIVYLAYTKGVQDGQTNLPPLIMADQNPVKVIPEIKPKDDLVQQNLSIYKSIESENQVQPVSPSPESLGDGSVESLYSDKNTSANGDDDLANLEAFLGDGTIRTPTSSKGEVSQDTPSNGLISQKVEKKTETISEIDPAPRTKNTSPASEIPSGDSNYIAQISSSRNEAQANTSFANLSKKFPDLLKNREPLVQRADLGEKGIFFRLGIGGFTSLSEAKAFCSSLKDKGQDCLVRKVN